MLSLLKMLIYTFLIEGVLKGHGNISRGFTKVYATSEDKHFPHPAASRLQHTGLLGCYSSQVAIPKLETLQIHRMNKLNKIWSSEVTRNENVHFSMLKTIKVEKCDWLVNLFPRNPMPLLHHLIQLSVKSCRSIKTIFKIDMGCVPETGEGSSSSLVSIVVSESENLRQVWSLQNVDSSNSIVHGFEVVESIKISNCVNFRNVCMPITANFNLKALQKIDIDYDKSSPEHQNNVISMDISFYSHFIHTFHQLRTLSLKGDREAQVVFDIESASSGELSTSQNNHLLPPCLEDLTLSGMDSMSHVWKCNWNQFFILQQPKFLCQNLTTITLRDCRSIKYLFSPLMFKYLSNLKHVEISSCEVMEEIVSNRDDEDEEMATSTSSITFSPILERLELRYLKSLQHIGGGGGSYTSVYNQFQQLEEAAVALWSLCQYSRHIEIEKCSALSIAIPSYALGHMQNLEELSIGGCSSMKDVFEIRSCSGGEGSGGDNNNNNSSSSVVSFTTPPQKLPNMILPPDLRNLRKLKISFCHRLRDVFPFSTLKSLTHLESLTIIGCDDIRVIVKKEGDGNHTTTTTSDDDDEVVVFPRLKTITLFHLPNLESFFLGTNDFRWPVLDSVGIQNCPNMTTFTQGRSDSPMLKYLTSHIGIHSVECGLNNFFHPTGSLQQEEVPYPSLDASTSLPFPERMPWFYNNLIKVHVSWRFGQRYIIGHNELQHMLKIEKLKISQCSAEREIFETLEMNNGLNQTHSIVEVREMDISILVSIKCLWKSKQWTVLKFPNLTRLSIDRCDSLKHVFTISMVGSLLQLKELHISNCKEMEIILEDVEKEEDNDDNEGKEEEDVDERRVNEVEFPCLRSLTLHHLKSLKGFCLGMETIHWPSLDTLRIIDCREITTFTNGESTTPKLKLIKTSFGLCDATEGVNSFIQTKVKEGYEFETYITGIRFRMGGRSQM